MNLRHERFTRWQYLVIATLSALYVLIVLKSAWITDDAIITFRTVDNFVHGDGLVWNLGERVQAYTHPLWLFVLTFGRLLTGETYYSVLLLSVIISLLAVLILALGIARSPTGAILGILILTCSKAFIDFSTSGLENPLTHLLLAIFFLIFFRYPRTHRFLLLQALIAGLLAINRIDALLLVLPALLLTLYRLRSIRSVGLVALGFAPFFAWELFSLFYYGFLYPNTAYAKLNAGIPSLVLIQQGFFYLLRSVDVDFLTILCIVVAVIVSFFQPERRQLALSLGIALYVTYVVRIGGDFMVSRFLTAPLFCATMILVRLPLPSLDRIGAYAIFAGVVVVSLFNPSTSALLSSAEYSTTADRNQIEDMRAHHDYFTGLLQSTAFNRLEAQGLVKGDANVAIHTSCLGLGMVGYYASPQAQIVDPCALTDALLARLPAMYTPDIFEGHFFRELPDGYLTTLQTGQNQIKDPKLAQFYDKLSFVIKGPLFSTERLREVLNFNLGKYNDLIDFDTYRYPDRLRLSLADVSRTAQVKRREQGPNIPPIVPLSGLQIDLEATSHAPFIELGLNSDNYQVSFLPGWQGVGARARRSAIYPNRQRSGLGRVGA